MVARRRRAGDRAGRCRRPHHRACRPGTRARRRTLRAGRHAAPQPPRRGGPLRPAGLDRTRRAGHAECPGGVRDHDRSRTPTGSSSTVPRSRSGPDGVDSCELLLAPHNGANLRPLAKGASGGELSRVMLACEVVLGTDSTVPTFVFDEVDAGVGGAAAVEVGRRLARLATTGPGRGRDPPGPGGGLRRPPPGGAQGRRRVVHQQRCHRGHGRGAGGRTRPHARWRSHRPRPPSHTPGSLPSQSSSPRRRRRRKAAPRRAEPGPQHRRLSSPDVTSATPRQRPVLPSGPCNPWEDRR